MPNLERILFLQEFLMEKMISLMTLIIWPLTIWMEKKKQEGGDSNY